MFNMGWVRSALEEWKEIDRAKIATQDYLNETRTEVESCATKMHEPIDIQE